MPRLKKIIPNQIQRALEFPFELPIPTKFFARRERSTQEKLYSPQFQVQPHYPIILNSLNKTFFSKKNNVGAMLQQHHYRPLLEMFGLVVFFNNISVDLFWKSLVHQVYKTQ